MAEIFITTQINSPVEIVFDLSRSIDLHKISTGKTKEEAIAGVTSGLINQHETVTWRARHLFKTRTFTSKITSMQRPFYFKDEMQQGDFKKFVHEWKLAKNKKEVLTKYSVQLNDRKKINLSFEKNLDKNLAEFKLNPKDTVFFKVQNNQAISKNEIKLIPNSIEKINQIEIWKNFGIASLSNSAVRL